jgi:hypothetical protein
MRTLRDSSSGAARQLPPASLGSSAKMTGTRMVSRLNPKPVCIRRLRVKCGASWWQEVCTACRSGNWQIKA